MTAPSLAFGSTTVGCQSAKMSMLPVLVFGRFGFGWTTGMSPSRVVARIWALGSVTTLSAASSVTDPLWANTSPLGTATGGWSSATCMVPSWITRMSLPSTAVCVVVIRTSPSAASAMSRSAAPDSSVT